MSARLVRFAAALLGVLAMVLAAGVNSAGASTSTTSTTVTGPITVLGTSWFTVQTAGRRVGVINALEAAATEITSENTPYVWGGGHAEAGVASTGEKGPGYNGRRKGFDCSGSVAAVLSAAGLWPSGAGVPADNGVISELLADHEIAPGVGTSPAEVTLYDDPGVHIFMNIDGHFFGTSDGAGGGDPAGGAGWLDDGAWDASSKAFKKYHFLPAVLAQETSYGNDFTFQLPPTGLFPGYQGSPLGIGLGELDMSDLLAGERVSVTYTTNGTGEMVVSTVAVISGGPVLAPPTTSGSTATTTTTPAPPPPSTFAPPATTTVPDTTTTVPTTTTTLPSPTVTVPAQTSDVTGGAGYGYSSGTTGGSGLG